MIRRGTHLTVLDNTTVSRVKCLGVLKRLVNGTLADVVLCIVKRELFRRRAFRKRFFFALLVNTRRPVYRRLGAYYVRFSTNGVLLLKDDKETFLGTRFYARIPLELRRSSYNEVCSYTRKTV